VLSGKQRIIENFGKFEESGSKPVFSYEKRQLRLGLPGCLAKSGEASNGRQAASRSAVKTEEDRKSSEKSQKRPELSGERPRQCCSAISIPYRSMDSGLFRLRGGCGACPDE
jgi:hypothetical protein